MRNLMVLYHTVYVFSDETLWMQAVVCQIDAMGIELYKDSYII